MYVLYCSNCYCNCTDLTQISQVHLFIRHIYRVKLCPTLWADNVLGRFRFPLWCGFYALYIISFCVIWRHAFRCSPGVCAQTWEVRTAYRTPYTDWLRAMHSTPQQWLRGILLFLVATNSETHGYFFNICFRSSFRCFTHTLSLCLNNYINLLNHNLYR